MQRLFTMPIHVTAVRFDTHGRTVPTRIDCGGRSYRLQSATNGACYGFKRGGRYYWIERHGRSWRWV